MMPVFYFWLGETVSNGVPVRRSWLPYYRTVRTVPLRGGKRRKSEPCWTGYRRRSPTRLVCCGKASNNRICRICAFTVQNVLSSTKHNTRSNRKVGMEYGIEGITMLMLMLMLLLLMLFATVLMLTKTRHEQLHSNSTANAAAAGRQESNNVGKACGAWCTLRCPRTAPERNGSWMHIQAEVDRERYDTTRKMIVLVYFQ